jgi:hypothetical protein
MKEMASNDVEAMQRSHASQVAEIAAGIVGRLALATETEIKRNSSGRPGPIPREGQHRRGWTTVPFTKGAVVGATIGNIVPYAMRLEFGFTGTDSLGRVYAQPPFPAAGPAMSVAGPALKAKLIEGIGKPTSLGLF